MELPNILPSPGVLSLLLVAGLTHVVSSNNSQELPQRFIMGGGSPSTSAPADEISTVTLQLFFLR